MRQPNQTQTDLKRRETTKLNTNVHGYAQAPEIIPEARDRESPFLFVMYIVNVWIAGSSIAISKGCSRRQSGHLIQS